MCATRLLQTKMSNHEEPGVPGAAEGSAEPTGSARVTAALVRNNFFIFRELAIAVLK